MGNYKKYKNRLVDQPYEKQEEKKLLSSHNVCLFQAEDHGSSNEEYGFISRHHRLYKVIHCTHLLLQANDNRRLEAKTSRRSSASVLAPIGQDTWSPSANALGLHYPLCLTLTGRYTPHLSVNMLSVIDWCVWRISASPYKRQLASLCIKSLDMADWFFSIENWSN